MKLERAAPRFSLYSLSDAHAYLTDNKVGKDIEFNEDIDNWFTAALAQCFGERSLCESQRNDDFSWLLKTMRNFKGDARAAFKLMCATTNYRARWYPMIKSGILGRLLILIIARTNGDQHWEYMRNH